MLSRPPRPGSTRRGPARIECLQSLVVAGTDARSFLQSQLSSDMAEVSDTRGQFSAWHDPKGRVLAIFRVLPWHDGYVLVSHAGLVPAMAQRMKMYILRARVTVQPGPPVHVLPPGDELHLPEGAEMNPQGPALGAVSTAAFSILRLPGQAGWLIVGDPGDAARPADPVTQRAWELAEIEAGIPEVYAETSGQFVAQMLNLDRIGAVSFTKGCFPGQEIVARAHHLGRVKRRARLFAVGGAPPRPGEALADAGGTVVRASASNGDSLLMAVVSTDSQGPFVLADGRRLAPSGSGTGMP
jgi:tRNA-modifying protein YgfZ